MPEASNESSQSVAYPELLAPAGDWDAMRAAVANGADAVYFGLSQFNARFRATNFTLEELPTVMEYLHGHNVRGYVTFNTLIFSDELPEALRFVRAVEQGGRVSAVWARGTGYQPVNPAPRKHGLVARATNTFEVCFEPGSVDLSAVYVGATVWKTDDPAVRRRLESSFRRDRVVRRIPLMAHVSASVGGRLAIRVTDAVGHQVLVEWDRPLEVAQKHPLTEQLFREQFGRMGDPPFELTIVRGLEQPSPAMVPKSVLNELRRQAIQRLLEVQQQAGGTTVAEPDVLERVRGEIRSVFGELSTIPSPGTPVFDPEAQTRGGDGQGEGSCRDGLERDGGRNYQTLTPALSRSAGSGSECPQIHVLVRSLEQLASASTATIRKRRKIASRFRTSTGRHVRSS